MEEYHRLIKLNPKNFKDYECFSSELINKIFGERSSEGVIEENINDSAEGIKASDLVNNWTQICEEIKTFPKLDELENLYNKLGVCKNLSDINVNSSLKN